MRLVTVFFFLLIPLSACSQFAEDFSDGEFTHNPAWTGDTAYWQVEVGKLKSRFMPDTISAKSPFFLSTPSSLVQKASWEFWLQLHFNTSRENAVEIYLVSDEENPGCDGGPCNYAHGYYVKIGGTEDNISLYRKDSANSFLLVKGRNGITNHSNNMMKVKVTCDSKYQWSLYVDTNGSGNNYYQEGTATDSTYLQSSFFSIVVYQSGKTAKGKHFFDDIKVAPFATDTISPVLKTIFPEDHHRVSLLFSEPITPASAKNLLNYSVEGDLIMPDSALVDAQNGSLVHLYFAGEIQSAMTYHLHIMHLSDLAGNEIDTTASFIFYRPRQYDVIIDELYPDPSPSHGLPEYEYVEIKNNSAYAINLAQWELCDPRGCAVFPPVMLPPDSLLIVCDKKAAAAFLPFGRGIGLNGFPALNNTGDEIILYDNQGKVIHAVIYNSGWYGDEEKDNGGWSLEMEDTRLPCMGDSNWTASTASLGGTPGRPNSVNTNNSIIPLLRLDYVTVIDSTNIWAHFNLGLDSGAAAVPGKYIVSNSHVDTVIPVGPTYHTVQLHLTTPLQQRKKYVLTTQALSCCGDIQQRLNDEAVFGVPEPVDSLDIIINEILFNPRTGSHDFVELYNHSSKIIDIRNLLLADRNSDGQITNFKTVSPHSCYLFPQEYLALTEDKQDLMRQYICKIPDNIFPMTALPPYPNIAGAVILLDTAGKMIDEVDYNEDDQSALVHNLKGVSLERINATGKSNDPANWHSASSVAGYATPGYLNSQSAQADTLSHAFTVSPEVFSPDADGMNDEAIIRYSLPTGFTGKVIIFDAGGRPIRHLLANSLLGTHGAIHWDGRNDAGKGMPVGVYVVYVQIFNLQGKVRHFKLPVVLARRP